uniref:SFRICE_035739 n=1 Tax=Spodoptera frugiperda TaxID=7108 RepID=A0A2H1W1D9_SPOFR
MSRDAENQIMEVPSCYLKAEYMQFSEEGNKICNLVVFLRLNYKLCGFSPWWWHVCNVALHAACCALVARTGAVVARLQRPFAALAALLFAVHPVHTEANFIS